MNVQSLKEAITTGLSTAGKALSDFVIWAGHKIRFLSQNYIIPALSKLWSAALNTGRAVQNLVKTGAGIPLTCAAGFFLIGIAAFKLADHKAYEDEILAKTAWKALGITAFAIATTATSIGLAAIIV